MSTGVLSLRLVELQTAYSSFDVQLCGVQMSTGVLSLRLVELQTAYSSSSAQLSSSNHLLVCLSTLSAPLLVNLRDGLFDVHPLHLPSLTDIGPSPLHLLIYFSRLRPPTCLPVVQSIFNCRISYGRYAANIYT